MAVIKHISSKSADYDAAIDYLMYQHDELSGKMLVDGEGRPLMRGDFLMDGINCEPLEYPLAAAEANARFGKNGARGDVKSHHYVLSFDPRDRDVGLTFDEAHRMAVRLAREWFGAYPGIVFTHPEGHNGSGNIHCHIVFCSVRVRDEPVREWMTHRSEWAAGGKHHATREHMDALKQAVMDMCRERNLHQVDLLDPAKERVTEREYWARRRLEIRERLDAGRTISISPGMPDETAKSKRLADENGTPREPDSREKPSRYRTHKQQIRGAVRDAAGRATDFQSFAAILEADHGITAKMSRGRITYKHPERERNVTGRALGIDYEWPVIEANIRHRLEHGTGRTRQNLVSQIDKAMKSRGAAYVNKVRSSNVRKLSESIAFLQEAGFASRDELDAALELSSESLAAAEASLRAAEASLSRVNRAIRASRAYLANRNVWRDYRASPDRKAFYMAHRRELEACNAARKELKELYPEGRAPSINELRAERERFILERNGKYESWVNERYRRRELETAKRNVDAMLGNRKSSQKVRELQRKNGELE